MMEDVHRYCLYTCAQTVSRYFVILRVSRCPRLCLSDRTFWNCVYNYNRQRTYASVFFGIDTSRFISHANREIFFGRKCKQLKFLFIFFFMLKLPYAFCSPQHYFVHHIEDVSYWYKRFFFFQIKTPILFREIVLISFFCEIVCNDIRISKSNFELFLFDF